MRKTTTIQPDCYILIDVLDRDIVVLIQMIVPQYKTKCAETCSICDSSIFISTPESWFAVDKSHTSGLCQPEISLILRTNQGLQPIKHLIQVLEGKIILGNMLTYE